MPVTKIIDTSRMIVLSIYYVHRFLIEISFIKFAKLDWINSPLHLMNLLDLFFDSYILNLRFLLIIDVYPAQHGIEDVLPYRDSFEL